MLPHSFSFHLYLLAAADGDRQAAFGVGDRNAAPLYDTLERVQ